MQSKQWNVYEALGLKWKLFIPICSLFLLSFLFISVFFSLNPTLSANSLIVGIVVFILNVFLIYLILSKILKSITKLNENSKKLLEGDYDIKIEAESGDEVGQLALLISEMQKNINVLSDRASDIAEKILIGRFFSRVDEKMLKGEYKNVATRINNVIENFVSYFDKLSMSVVITDKDYNIKFLNKHTINLLNNPKKLPIDIPCYKVFDTMFCKTDKCSVCIAMRTGEVNSCVNAARMGKNILHIQNTSIPIQNSKGEIIGALELTYSVDSMNQKTAQEIIAQFKENRKK